MSLGRIAPEKGIARVLCFPLSLLLFLAFIFFFFFFLEYSRTLSPPRIIIVAP